MAANALDTLRLIGKTLVVEYNAKTPSRLKVIDCFLAYAAATCVILFLYMLAVGTFPFNSFLAAFFTAGGFFVLTVALRMQLDPLQSEHFRRSSSKGGSSKESGGKKGAGTGGKPLSPERAVADYVLAGALLLFVAWNYVG